MRVLMLPGYRYPASLEEPLICGDLRYSFNLSRALARKGVPTTVLTRRTEGDPESHELDGVRIERYRPELGRLFSTSFDMSFDRFRRFRRLAGDADALIANSPLSLELGARLPRPFVYVCSGIEDVRNYGGTVRERAQRLGIRLLRDPARKGSWKRADRVNTTAERERSTLRRMGVPEAQVTAIGPGVEIQRYYPREGLQVEALRAELDQSGGGRHLILSVSRFTPAKGIPETLRAFAALRAGRNNVALVLVGVRHSHRSGQFEAVRALIAELGLKGDVVLRENVPERLLPIYYSSATMTSVFSTGYDPLPTVMIESMSCGTPVLSTAFETRKQVIDDGRTGLLVPEADGAAWVGAAQRLIDDRALSGRLRLAGLDLVRRRYDMDLVADEYLQLFDSI